MKTLKLFVVCVLMIFAGTVHSQISVNVNVGTPPAWGPAGYSDVKYYYLPDMELYYDVHRSNFIYFTENNWVRRNYLPPLYQNYDLYKGYKVPIQNYSGNFPHFYFKQHKIKYAKGYVGKPQKNIGRKGDKIAKQYVKNQNRNNNGNGQIKMINGNGQKMNKGNGNGNGNGNGKGKK